jgi:hypothetical protein
MKRLAMLAVLAVSATASAHKPSDAHVQIAVSGDRVTGTLAVALRDLDGALDLDGNGNGDITWAETLTAAPRIAAYARERLTIAGCTLAFGGGKLVDFSDGAYWAMPITGTCDGEPATLTVTYALLFDIDAQHRGIVQVQTARMSRTIVVRSAAPIVVALESRDPLAYAAKGAARVWTSPLELLVLACLLLPLLAWGIGSAAGGWRAIGAVTGAFALGSAATLLLATSRLIWLPPPAIVAPVVLGSVVLAAAINLLRVRDGRRTLAFELGLVHGVAAALWLDSSHVGPALGFAAGVAFAQAAFVAVAAAALATIRRTFAYRVLVWGGSAATAVGVLAWMCLT